MDFGTGDGSYAYRLARASTDTLVIGVDANADAMRENSARAAAKPSKGGLGNLLFARGALAEAPGPLLGLASSLSVVLPWGSLLEAVSIPQCAEVERLKGILAPGGTFSVLFGYSEADRLSLPALSPEHLSRLAFAWEGKARFLPLEEVRAVPSTWAKKLAFSGRNRSFVRIEGRVPASPLSREN